MKAGKLLASILVVSMALPMCACKPTSSKETDDPTGKTSEKKPTGTVTTDTEVPTDSSDGTEPSVTPSVPSTVSDESTDPLVIYGYDKDFEQVLADYLTDIEYEYVYVDPSSYTQELNNAIVLGEKKPDLFMMDADNLEAWATSENSLGIEQVGISRAELSDQFQYTYDAATTNDNSIKALAFELQPAAVFYNRAEAEQFLGTADPSKVAPMVSSWDILLEYAREVSMNSEGAKKLIADRTQISDVFWAGHTSSWVEDGAVKTDSDFDKYVTLQSTLYHETLTMDLPVGSTEWQQAVSGGQCVLFFASLKTAADVIGYVPGHKEVEEPTTETSAQEAPESTTTPPETGWSIVPAPTPSFDGGMWLMVASTCDRKESAGKVLRMFTMDQTILTELAVKGQFVNSMSIMEKCAADPNFTSDFLNGQNPYTILVPEAKKIAVAKNITIRKYAVAEIDKLLPAYYDGEIETLEELKELFTVGLSELLGLS